MLLKGGILPTEMGPVDMQFSQINLSLGSSDYGWEGREERDLHTKFSPARKQNRNPFSLLAEVETQEGHTYFPSFLNQSKPFFFKLLTQEVNSLLKRMLVSEVTPGLYR